MSGDWHLLIRRAYGVPDVLGEDAAAEHIAFFLAEAAAADQASALAADTRLSDFREQVESLGDHHDLDGFFVEVRYFSLFELATSLAQKLGMSSDVTELMLVDLLGRVRGFLEKYPFRTADGIPIQ